MSTDLEHVRALDPAAGPLPAGGRTALAAGLRATGPEPGWTSVSRLGHRMRRPVIAGAVAVGLAGALLWAGLGPTSAGGASPAAAAVLTSAAAAVGSDAHGHLGPGQYLDVRETSYVINYQGDIAYLTRDTVETWIPGDHSANWVRRETFSAPLQFFGPNGPAGARADFIRQTGPLRAFLPQSSTAPGGRFHDQVGWLFATPAFMADLPRGQHELRDRLYQDSRDRGVSADQEAWVYLTDLLGTADVPADLRAALLRVARLIPGVVVLDGEVADNGRTGVGIGRAADIGGERDELVIDPATGQIIGWRTVYLAGNRAGVPAGYALPAETTTSSVVDGIPDPPSDPVPTG